MDVSVSVVNVNVNVVKGGVAVSLLQSYYFPRPFNYQGICVAIFGKVPGMSFQFHGTKKRGFPFRNGHLLACGTD